MSYLHNECKSLFNPKSENRNGFGVCLVAKSIFHSDEQLYIVYTGVWFAKHTNICSFIEDYSAGLCPFKRSYPCKGILNPGIRNICIYFRVRCGMYR